MPTHIMFSSLLSIIILMIMMILKSKYLVKFSSMANVECGFNSMTQKKFKFSNQFFMVSLLFVIFDMELIAIFPIPLLQKIIPSFILLMSIMIFLSFSILMEWMSGMIEWTMS